MKLACALFSLLLLTGCDGIVNHHTVVVNSHVPVISEPERPKEELLTSDEAAAFNALSESAKTKIVGNNKTIKIYASQLEASVLEYNKYAKQHNAVNEAWVNSIGKKDKQ